MPRVKLTPEQRKINKKEADRKYREANKEHYKAYYEANKDKIYESRKERLKVYGKKRRQSKKLDNLFIVYCLPYTDIPYCGITNRPDIRMIEHGTVGNDTTDWFILQVCNTRDEALKIESEYHKKGYLGAK